MKNTGIIKYIDNLSRQKIPIELCEFFDIKANDYIDFSQKGKNIVLQKNYSSCIFCHSQKNILDFKNKKICQNCINSIKRWKLNSSVFLLYNKVKFP